MQENVYHISQLMIGQLKGELSAAQQKELDDLLTEFPEYRILAERLSAPGGLDAEMQNIVSVDKDAARKKMVDHLFPDDMVEVPSRHRIGVLRRWGWAAAVVILMVGAYLFTVDQRKQNPITSTEPVPVKDVYPGGNKALLTLADGATIVLDSATNGQLAREAGANVIKMADGQLEYQQRNGEGNYISEVTYNTMKTPRGGQYRLKLPDGTRVWLNAASSITYPVVFTGKYRKVTVIGEAYFEVAKNPGNPFIVNVIDREEVEVLGTNFNICAYLDEPAIRTTLIEGAVKINNNLLEPGEVWSDGKIRKANIEETLAWINGRFQFRNAELKTMMRQLARWYDIEVEYQGKMGKRFFTADIPMNENLSSVIKILEMSNINCRIEAKKLIVTP